MVLTIEPPVPELLTDQFAAGFLTPDTFQTSGSITTLTTEDAEITERIEFFGKSHSSI
jgi:hypothetical protein